MERCDHSTSSKVHGPPGKLTDPPEDVPWLQVEHILCTHGSLDHVAPCRKACRGQIAEVRSLVTIPSMPTQQQLC